MPINAYYTDVERMVLLSCMDVEASDSGAKRGRVHASIGTIVVALAACLLSVSYLNSYVVC